MYQQYKVMDLFSGVEHVVYGTSAEVCVNDLYNRLLQQDSRRMVEAAAYRATVGTRQYVGRGDIACRIV